MRSEWKSSHISVRVWIRDLRSAVPAAGKWGGARAENDIFFATTAPEFFQSKSERLQVDRDQSISPPSSPHSEHHHGDKHGQFRLRGDQHGQFRLRGDQHDQFRLRGDQHGQFRLRGDKHDQFRLRGDQHGQFRLRGDKHDQFRLGGDKHGQFRLRGDKHGQFRLRGDKHGQFRLRGDKHDQFRLRGDKHDQFRLIGDQHGSPETRPFRLYRISLHTLSGGVAPCERRCPTPSGGPIKGAPGRSSGDENLEVPPPKASFEACLLAEPSRGLSRSCSSSPTPTAFLAAPK
uniref:Uncharacterized protein n=1 Tax=Timema monikensis TaxID=170555 RepID=A0A7R9EGC7_9NEOP|nr:unnamed protein product [Timema monikensis]